MEAFLARAALAWPAALAWETILVCGDVSACFFFKPKRWLLGCPKQYFAGDRQRWNLYTKLPLARTGLELDQRFAAVVKSLLPANLKGCLV